jgi:hypothetical protein
VDGSGISAVVNVTKELLDRNTAAAIQLVEWLTAELRKQELANANKSGT